MPSKIHTIALLKQSKSKNWSILFKVKPTMGDMGGLNMGNKCVRIIFASDICDKTVEFNLRTGQFEINRVLL